MGIHAKSEFHTNHKQLCAIFIFLSLIILLYIFIHPKPRSDSLKCKKFRHLGCVGPKAKSVRQQRWPNSVSAKQLARVVVSGITILAEIAVAVSVDARSVQHFVPRAFRSGACKPMARLTKSAKSLALRPNSPPHVRSLPYRSIGASFEETTTWYALHRFSPRTAEARGTRSAFRQQGPAGCRPEL
jgi:hypothetical protein